MENLEIKSTKNTPYVNFNYKEGILAIEGRSYPNDSVDFFEPLFDWCKNYIKENIKIRIRLEYFNTSTCKQLLSLIRVVINNNGQDKVTVEWQYEVNDVDVLEIGEHMQEILKSKFKFTSYNENKTPAV